MSPTSKKYKTISYQNGTSDLFRPIDNTSAVDSGNEVYKTSELLSDAGKAIINKHIDSYIKNKTFEGSTLPATTPKATLDSTIAVSSQIFVSVEDSKGKFRLFLPYKN